MAQRANLEEISQPLHDAYACLLANGLDGAGEALRILVNEASRIERAQHLQAMPYERSAQRVDQANGYKSKTMLTRMGEITFEVPQVRTAGFYPSALERGSRSEQSVNLALAEMYVQGVSTRKVIEVLQKLVGSEVSISSTQISRYTQKLDENAISSPHRRSWWKIFSLTLKGFKMNKVNKVQANVGSLVDMGKRFTLAWGRAGAGKKISETHITFLDVQTMLETLSPRRLEVLKFVRQHGAENTKELALSLKRDYKNVHGDVAVLESAGLLLRDGRKLSAPWDELNACVSLTH